MHFRDKDDLFVHSISRISEELYEQILPLIFSEGGTVGQMPVLMIFQHAQANADLYRVILNGAGNGQGLQQLRHDLTRYVQRVLEAEVIQQDLSPSVPVEVIGRSFVGSLLGLVQWWLEQGYPYPAEEMTRMLRQLFNLGRHQVMGLEQ
jgi:AcrR family transcriptional regulator